MTLNPLRAEDLPQVVDFAVVSGAFAQAHPGEIFDKQYVLRLWQDCFTKGIGGGAIAVEHELVVGVIAWVTAEGWYSPQPIVDVVLWAVDPHYKSQVAGVRLLEAARAKARQMSTSLHLEAGQATPLQLTWSLARLGFEPSLIGYTWRA